MRPVGQAGPAGVPSVTRSGPDTGAPLPAPHQSGTSCSLPSRQSPCCPQTGGPAKQDRETPVEESPSPWGVCVGVCYRGVWRPRGVSSKGAEGSFEVSCWPSSAIPSGCKNGDHYFGSVSKGRCVFTRKLLCLQASRASPPGGWSGRDGGPVPEAAAWLSTETRATSRERPS